MTVIYAEKPDTANKIAAALGSFEISGRKIGWHNLQANEKAVKAHQFKEGFLKTEIMGKPCLVTWGFGHMCALYDAEDYDPSYKQWQNLPVPFIPDRYLLKIQKSSIPDRAKKQLDIIKSCFCKADLIISATDPDREGELIFAYVYEYLGCRKPYKRVYFTSQTREGIVEAFGNLKSSSHAKPLENAGRGRSIADSVVGKNLTAQLSLKIPNSGVWSVGRVQTPTLNMIAKREAEIKNFKKKPFWTLNGKFSTALGGTYLGRVPEKYMTESDAKKALSAVTGKKGKITEITRKESKKDVPQLYSLSVLQMDCNTKYSYTLQETLDSVQKLYDGGYVTYPRTDSRYLTDDMEPTVHKALDALQTHTRYRDLVEGKPRKWQKNRYFDSSKVSSHFAIIPTGVLPKTLSERDADVYDLICRSVIRMIYPKAVIEETSVKTSVEGTVFETKSMTVKEKGWLEVTGLPKERLLPELEEGKSVDGSYGIKEGMTEPPKRYTDTTLVAAMKAAGKELSDEDLKKVLASTVEGIGTEATRAGIVETLEKRGYIERKNKSICATQKGMSLIENLPCSALKSPELTAQWEKELTLISEGKSSLDDFIRAVENQTGIWCMEILKMTELDAPDALGSCPLCGKGIKSKKWGYGCTGYKNGCKFSISGKILNKKITAAQVRNLLSKGITGIIKGFVGKSGKKFDAKLKLEGDRVEFVFKDNKRK